MQTKASRSLSTTLVETCEQLPEPQITLAQLTALLGTRAYGVLLVVLTILNMLPVLSIIGGVVTLMYSIQMALNLKTPWLPRWLATYAIDKQLLNQGVNVMLPKLQAVEHYITPRFPAISSPWGIRVSGLFIALFAMTILIPLPFTNFWPAIATLFLALGLLQKDGLTILISMVVGTLYCIGVYYLLVNLAAKLLT